jgi:hypothetical protein
MECGSQRILISNSRYMVTMDTEARVNGRMGDTPSIRSSTRFPQTSLPPRRGNVARNRRVGSPILDKVSVAWQRRVDTR